MKSTNLPFTLGLMALAILVTPFASADDTGWYAGANLGQSSAKIDNSRITGALQAGGLTTSSITNDDRDLAYKIYTGYQFNRYFAVEGGYFDLGEFGFSATTVPAGTYSGNARLRGLNLDLVGILPITEKFSAFGRVGANYAQARDAFAGTGAVRVTNPNPSQRDTNLKLGMGLQYALTDALSARAEVERYRINDAIGNKGDVNHISFGLAYRFGPKAQTPAPRAAAPAMIAAASAPVLTVVAPAPAPIAAPPQPLALPAPRVPQRVTFSADSLFDFDRDVVKPEGKRSIDKFAHDMVGTEFDTVTVTGHTDRLGSHQYNMKLSTRRADAVKVYLADSAGIPLDKIIAKGASDSKPATSADDCKGTKASGQLIACLQPDRRVEIEVSGTR